MKFSVRQMLASAVGAVIAASIASLFGVKGTIVGVAIGSAAATLGTAAAAQSIERTHSAVRHAVVRAPDTSLIRRLGATLTTGTVTQSAADADAGAGPAAAVDAAGAATDPVPVVESPAQAETEPLPDTGIMALTGPQTETMPAGVVAQVTAPEVVPASQPGRRWPATAGMIAIVFIVSLLLVTAIELIAGKPLSSIFGGATHGGTTVQNIFGGTPAPKATTTTTVAPTTTTTGSSTTTTTTTGSSTTTTSTTVPSTTTTTLPGTTTTTGVVSG